MEEVRLPGWIKDQLPKFKEPYHCSYQDGQYAVTTPKNETLLFPTLLEAYQNIPRGEDFELDEATVPEVIKAGGAGSLISVRDPERNAYILIFSNTDKDRVRLLESEYEYFLRTAEDYRTNPNSFPLAYTFIDTHPAFWFRRNSKKDYSWITNEHARRLWVVPSFKTQPNGDVVTETWMLEAGASVPPAYTSHYHDLRLDVYAPTLEEGYVQLAALVDKFFDDEGIEKENVEYEKSDLELLLEARFVELEKE